MNRSRVKASVFRVFNMSSRFAVLALGACAFAGYGAEPAPPPREKVVYFPITVGAKWVRTWSSASGKEKDREVVEAVAEVIDGKDGTKIVTVVRVGEQWTRPMKVFEISNAGLFWTKNHAGNSAGLPWCELKLPHTPGQTWGAGLDSKLTAHGPEKIKVPAGEFECIRVEYRDSRGPDPVQTRWYAKGIGEVKVTSGDLVIVLKSFTPGRE